jgi:hypothetical protein
MSDALKKRAAAFVVEMAGAYSRRIGMMEPEMKKPKPYATDHDFLRAVEGYLKCANPDQEMRLSLDQLRRLAQIARRGLG